MQARRLAQLCLVAVHLTVAAAPCAPAPAALALPAPAREAPVAAAVDAGDGHAGHAGHADHARHTGHAASALDAAAGHDRGHAHSGSPGTAAGDPPRDVRLEAPCPCGCDAGPRAGSTVDRTGPALLAAAPPLPSAVPAPAHALASAPLRARALAPPEPVPLTV